ncbi:sigma-70 family RNA polymerase sigma factor [Caldibacillus lycopersici]|uniref:Sigma-70 family RNA polymerase sigma factor n=1 Tax=Perspicuibacillus lycopersici TaxID=1325689 RepID=A0AAE3LLP8_9BACI|nr:sigma-70 family RNA polymerase sigma factor [Perspicuibacillus lycopersici]MCU9612595.1 sigma-70 family RNA polymerase sigma factor [Perspicuibacillus lycopersici]
MNWTDDVLVHKSLQGNYDAYAELVHRYSNLVYGLALSRTRDSYISEDIAQEVFVKAWMKLPQLSEGEKFSHWIMKITKNQCTDFFRKKNQHTLMENFPENNKVDDSNSIQAMVWEALQQIEEKYRIVIVMNYISGYTAKEIGNLLQLSSSAIESRLRRGKEKLKKELLIEMSESFGGKRVREEFAEEVMWRIVPRIATIEIPVTNLPKSIAWYSKLLGLKAVYQDENSCMLHLQGSSRIGVPTIYLVKTEDERRLLFKNTFTGIIHSVIDFYIDDLERFHHYLQQEGVKVTNLNYFPGTKQGGFGFEDPDGNLLSATNVTHSGQI